MPGENPPEPISFASLLKEALDAHFADKTAGPETDRLRENLSSRITLLFLGANVSLSEPIPSGGHATSRRTIALLVRETPCT